jgi:hypothetical protein
MGELLRTLEKHQGGRPPQETGRDPTTSFPPTLSDLGYTKDQSHRWQTMAEIGGTRQQGGDPPLVKREPRGSASPKLTRSEAAREAGLSDDQRKTALRVATIPEE